MNYDIMTGGLYTETQHISLAERTAWSRNGYEQRKERIQEDMPHGSDTTLHYTHFYC